MKRLLKLYLLDYLKKITLTLMGAITVGYVIFSPVAENFTEQMYFMNWTVYIALYGVFFYHYPLKKIALWSVNTPITKEGLVAFNIIYQLFKILMTFAALGIVIGAELYFFKDNIYVEKLSDNVLLFKEIFISKKLPLFQMKFLPSEYLLAIVIGSSFIFAFIFNVAPYGTFQQRILTLDNIKNGSLYFIKKYPKSTILFLVFLFSLKWLTTARPILASIFVFLLGVLIVKTYDNILLFQKRFEYKLYFGLGVFAVFSGLGLFRYSNFIQGQHSLTNTELLKEKVFLGHKVFNHSPLEKLYSVLKDPKICDNDFKSIVRLYRKMDLPDDKKLFSNKNAFNDIVLNKSACGIKYALKFIPEPGKLTIEQKNKVFIKLGEILPPESPEMAKDTLNLIPADFFTDFDTGHFISKNNYYAQLASLYFLKDAPDDFALTLLKSNHHRFSPLLEAKVREVLLEKTCLIHEGEIQNILKGNLVSKCKSKRDVASILPEDSI